MIGSAFYVMGKSMHALPGSIWIAVCALILSGCSQSDDIDAHGAVYDGIAANETITLNGTEPFWGVVISPQNDGSYQARIRALDGLDEAASQPVKVSRFAGNNGLGFSGELNDAPIIFAITPGECSDGMSDRIYPFAATATISDETLRGCGFTSSAPFSGPQEP